MKKIVFGITSLRLGGAERVLVDIVNRLVSKYDITIFTLYGKGEFFSQLDSRIKIVSLYENRYEEYSSLMQKKISLQMLSNGARKKIYDTYIKDKFDIEVAFLEGPMTWIFGYPGLARKIAWVHNDIEDVFGSGLSSSLKQKMNKKSYSFFNQLVFVSNANLEKFKEYFPDNHVNKTVIYNYLNQDVVIEKANLEKIQLESPSFVQVSRLVEQKAVQRLIEVHHKLIEDGHSFHTYVVGDGPLRSKLESLIEEYAISDTFHLLGARENPYPYIAAADTFILTSYYEGYPMVLLEAKALNKFIMITDSAARETLIDYEQSLIVPNNEEGIYEGIQSILEKKDKPKKGKKQSNAYILEEIGKVLEGKE